MGERQLQCKVSQTRGYGSNILNCKATDGTPLKALSVGPLE